MKLFRRMLLPLAIALMVLTAQIPALAGGNGQQIYVTSASAYSVYISGTNQNGVPSQHCFSLPTYTTYLNNFWWKYTTDLYFYNDSTCGNSGGSFLGFVETWVPPSQSGDWWHVTF